VKVLFLSQRVPFPPDRGDRITTYHFLQHFLEQGASIRVGALSEEARDAESVEALRGVAGDERVLETPLIGGAEDFSFFQEEVPGFYFFLGAKPLDVAREDASAHHTPGFFVDENGLSLGVKALMAVTLDYMGQSSLSTER